MKKIKMEKKNKANLIIFILLLATLFFMTVGFAAYGQVLNLGGTVTLKPDGKIYMKSVRLTGYSAANEVSANPQINPTTGFVDFNLQFTTHGNKQEGYYADFEIVVANESSYDYVYTVPNYQPSATKVNSSDTGVIDYTISGITTGEVIPSHTEKTFTIRFTFRNTNRNPGTYVVDGDFNPSFTEDESATLRGTVDETQTGDFTGSNELALYEISVMNTYSVPKTFTIISENEKFEARNLDNTGIPQYQIPANTTEEIFQFYLKEIPGSDFVSTSERVRISIVPTGESEIYSGRVIALVDRTIDDFSDTTPPTISNVKAEIQNTNGTVLITWIGDDDSGEDPQNYTIVCFNSDGQEVSRRTTTDSTESYTYTGLSAGNYYFTVFGTDKAGNSASASQITSATTSTGPACRSGEATEYKWVFSVTRSLSNCSSSNTSNSINRGDTYTTRLSGSGSNYTTPTSGNVSVTMGGQSISNYTYENGTLTISNVTGDLVISAQGTWTCLAQGTKVLLANGKYKNIEDIKYTDLLRVYNHVTGEFTNVYPIWIEQEGFSDKYRKLTFSDGSYLKVISNHSVFDVDKKMYINVANDDECKIGTRVYKVKDDKLEIVTITNIEDINEGVKYYNVVSTMYYNIIANDILTTDATSSISNIYGFTDNAVYGENYYKICSGEKLEYKDVSFIPYYLYKGLNLQNAKSLINNGLDLEFLKTFIKEHTLKPIE